MIWIYSILFQAAYCSTYDVDLLWLVDGTGSYSGYFDVAAANFKMQRDVLKTYIDEGYHYRMSLCFFGDKGPNRAPMKEQWSMALSLTDVDQISDAMVDSYFTSKSQMSWGGDTPEDVLMGLVFGLTDPAIGWNTDAVRQMQVFTDNPFHDASSSTLGTVVPPLSIYASEPKIVYDRYKYYDKNLVSGFTLGMLFNPASGSTPACLSSGHSSLIHQLYINLVSCDSACEKLYAITFPTALTTTGLTGPNGWFPNSKTCPGFEIPRVTRVVYGSDTVTESFVKIQDLLVVQKEETKKTIETIVFEESWSDWSSWNKCSETCGTGTATRTRSCTNGTPGVGLCAGSELETVSCNTQNCEVWSTWNVWNTCSKPCGIGITTRTRLCIGGTSGVGQCLGTAQATNQCNKQNCAELVDCQLEGSCSVTCGGGVRTCNRICKHGIFGVNTECPAAQELKSENCNPSECPVLVECELTGSCSVTCGEGVRTCNRTCNNGVFGVNKECPASEEIKSENCNSTECPELVECQLTGSCSVTCGGGVRTCNRICKHGIFGVNTECPTAQELKSESCNPSECPVLVECQHTGSCSVTCGGGVRTCNRICNNGVFGVNKECPASQELNSENCNPSECPKLVDCQVQGPCSGKCGGGVRLCSRICDHGTFGVSMECPADQETKSVGCNKHKCHLETHCEVTGISVLVPDDVWEKYGVDPQTTRLSQKGTNCIYTRGPTYMEYKMPLSAQCGTEIENVDEHIFYRNMIIGHVGKSAVPITRLITTDIDFSCKFDSHFMLTIDFHPLIVDNHLKIATLDIDFDVQMGMYTDSSFSQPLNNNATIEVPDLLYSQITLKKGPESFKVQLRQCKATPTNNPEEVVNYIFIDDFCPIYDDSSIIGNASGISQTVQFTLQTFVFTTEPTANQSVFIHCDVVLCDQKLEDCERDCPSKGGVRKRRSNEFPQSEEITTNMKIGPIKLNSL